MTIALSLIGVSGLVAIIAISGYIQRRLKERAARRRALVAAASAGDVPNIEDLIERGVPVDARDEYGSTALHHAYYGGHQLAVERLVAFGASESVRNKEGCIPAEMAKMAEIDPIVAEGVALVTLGGGWLDSARALPIYHALRAFDQNLVSKGIVRALLGFVRPVGGGHGQGSSRRRVFLLAVKLGRAGSERWLLDMLEAYGDQLVATDFLNSGSRLLKSGAESWARRHGYRIIHSGGSANVRWGVF